MLLRGEGIAQCKEGGLRIEISVEGKWTLGQTVFARTKVLQPGIAVRETPRENGFDGIVGQDGGEE